MENGNDDFYCGEGVSPSVSLEEVEELALSDKILIGNRVRMALLDYARILRESRQGESYDKRRNKFSSQKN